MNDDNDMNEYDELLYPFISDDPQFSRGFETGSLHVRLQGGETVTEQLVHTDNALQLEMVCAHFCDRDQFSIKRIDEMWSELNARPRPQ